MSDSITLLFVNDDGQLVSTDDGFPLPVIVV